MKKLYLDMDGTIARFHDEVSYLERMYEEGFFFELKPFSSVIRAVRRLIADTSVEVFVLSSCVTEQCKDEKKKWLEKFLPEIPESNYILTEMGQNKALCLGHSISDEDVLLDDYNRNLEDWKTAGGHAVKLVNNINDKGRIGPRWVGDRVYAGELTEEILLRLKTLVA